MARTTVGEVLSTLKGFSLQGLREEYQGEDRKMGWRTPTPKKTRADFGSDAEYDQYLAKFKALEASDRTTTKYFNDAERDAAKVTFDEKGRAVGKLTGNADGTVSGPEDVMRNKSVEYVADEKGTLHQFRPETRETGERMFQPVAGKEVAKTQVTHHSSVLAGGAVAGAGELELDYEGYVKKISNKSGHYKPGAAQMIQLLEELARQGALLDKSYQMPDAQGKGQPLAGKPKEIFDAIEKVEGGLRKKLAEGQSIEPDLAAIKKGKEALAKLGVAPANKFRNVQVEFLEGADKKKGADVRTTAGATSTAEEFLRSGGGARKTVTEVHDVAAPPAQMPPSFGSSNLDPDDYPPAAIAQALGIAEADLAQAEDEGALFANDLLRHFGDQAGVKSIEELYTKLVAATAGSRPTTRTVEVTKSMASLKGDALKALQEKHADVRKALDADAERRAAALPGELKKIAEQLPRILEWYRAELKKAETDRSDKSAARQAELKRSIARVEAASRPTDDSDAGLAKLLAELQKQYAVDRAAAPRRPAQMPSEFANTALSRDDYPYPLLAQRLGLSVEEVQSAEDDGLLYPGDLLKNGDLKSKIGVKTIEELFRKIVGD